LSLREEEILATESVSHSLPSVENPINGAATPGLWEEKIPAANSNLRVGEIPQRSVLESCREACVAASE